MSRSSSRCERECHPGSLAGTNARRGRRDAAQNAETASEKRTESPVMRAEARRQADAQEKHAKRLLYCGQLARAQSFGEQGNASRQDKLDEAKSTVTMGASLPLHSSTIAASALNLGHRTGYPCLSPPNAGGSFRYVRGRVYPGGTIKVWEP